MFDTLLADRGGTRECACMPGHSAVWSAAARLGNLKIAAPAATLWIQVRGQSRIEAREGGFRLSRGEWLVLERDSAPLVQSHRNALVIGVAVPAERWDALNASLDLALMPGHGRLSPKDTRMALRLWRQGAAAGAGSPGDLRGRCLQTLAMHLAALQRELAELYRRCPGRSQLRKRIVLGRMQRARLYLEGNAHRVVRLSELADLTSQSIWHFSKTFRCLYDESPQAAAVRLRLELACRLLRETGMSISEVGAACGFENCCSFSRKFRAHYRMTASQYRRREEPRLGGGELIHAHDRAAA